MEVAPITRLDTDLDWGFTTYYDPELDMEIDVGGPWRIDCWPRQGEVTVTLKDGRTIACPADELYDALEEALGYPVNIWWETDENPDDTWGPGDHTATFHVGGVAAEYTVTVIEDPIAFVEVAPITRLETNLSGWTDYYDEAIDDWVDPGYRWRIDCWPGEITVTMKDGETFTGEPWELYDAISEAYGVYPDIGWDSDERPDDIWGPGEHTAVFQIGGAEAEYAVTVIESPIASIEVAPLTLRLCDTYVADGYYDVDNDEWVEVDWERFDCFPAEITVTMKDGESFTCHPDEINGFLDDYVPGGYLDFWWDNDETPDNPWGVGEHEAALYANGEWHPYTVTVVPCPTVKLAADGATAKLEGDYAGLYVRLALVLQLNDGKSGLYVTQGAINKDGTVVMPAFYVPGLTVRGVNVALVRSLDEIPSSTPRVISSDFQYAS